MHVPHSAEAGRYGFGYAEEITLFRRRATLACVFCVGFLFVKGGIIVQLLSNARLKF